MGPQTGSAVFRVPLVMVVPYPDVRLLGTQPQVTGTQSFKTSQRNVLFSISHDCTLHCHSLVEESASTLEAAQRSNRGCCSILLFTKSIRAVSLLPCCSVRSAHFLISDIREAIFLCLLGCQGSKRIVLFLICNWPSL